VLGYLSSKCPQPYNYYSKNILTYCCFPQKFSYLPQCLQPEPKDAINQRRLGEKIHPVNKPQATHTNQRRESK